MPVQVTCDVYVAGVRLPDRADDLTAGEPTGLDGLTITWGRASTADQPDVSTLAFDVVDRAGGAGFLSTLKVGASVDVLATGQIPASAGSFGPDVVDDGSFEAIAAGPAGPRVRLEGAGTTQPVGPAKKRLSPWQAWALGGAVAACQSLMVRPLSR